VRAAGVGLRAQLLTLSGSPDSFLTLLTMPLSTVVLLATVLHAGRPDLVAHALVAPVLMAQWAMALLVAGDLVETERAQGTLELLVASPAPFPLLLAGRITAVTAVSTAAFAEAWAVATLGFGVDVTIGHPLAFAVAALATAFAVAGWATVFSAGLVLAGPVRFLQNTLTFPVYVLSGVLVPVALLPGILRLPSRALFLTWSADLLRDAYGAPELEALPARVGVIVGLGTVGFLIGNGLLGRALQSLRSTGRLGLSEC